MNTKDIKFSAHLIQRIKERNLHSDWIWKTIKYPDEKIIIAENEHHFYKIIDSQNKWLKVIVNPIKDIVITAHFDRNKKNKEDEK